MTYLHLKITGTQPMHGRLPGEEFYVMCDGSERPVNALWAKRLAEEQQHNSGFVSVVGTVASLPGDAPPELPQAQGDTIEATEQRILTAVARAVAGIRAEIVRTTTTEIASANKRFAKSIDDLRTQLALVSDAWRVRATLPPDWHHGMPIDVVPPPMIEAYAANHHGGDVAAAAMALTEADDRWQIDAASRLVKTN